MKEQSLRGRALESDASLTAFRKALEAATVAAIEAGVPTLVEGREIIAEFHMMIRRKAEAGRAS